MTVPADFKWLSPLELANWDPPGREFVEKLREVLTALDPARIEEHMELATRAPAGVQDRENLLDPAVYSLICYGKPGVEALKRLGVGHRPKVGLDAIGALLSCAQGRGSEVQSRIALAHRYMEKSAFERLWDAAEVQCRTPEVQQAADLALTKCIKGVVANDASGFDAGVLLMGGAGLGGATVVNRVVQELAHSALRLTDDICDEFESLLGRSLPEADYQAFLERHPALVDPLASEVVNRQALAEQWKTDFVIRRLDSDYVFVELEKPSDVPVDKYPAPRPPLAHAIGQVVNWFIWVEDNIAYAQSHGFPGIHNPRGVVIIGRDSALTVQQRRHFKALSDALGPRIQLLTFDDVLRHARNIVRNMVSRKV